MVEIRTEVDLLDSWFMVADRDGDGRVGGNEAVEFFQRSGLAKEPLFQIWNAVSNNTPYLSKQQFYTAMRLVSAAQRNGGKLSEAEARSILVGLGPALPPPTMTGLDQLKSTVPQILAQAHATVLPGATAGDAVQILPPMTGDDVQKYQGLFAELDTDHDGYVLGKDCFEVFMRWGLPKDVLREIWNLVASNQGQLDAHQFISCVYLMDAVKKGFKLPDALPNKKFPPLASYLGADVTISDLLAGDVHPDVFSREISVPPPPARARYVDTLSKERMLHVPPIDADTLSHLDYADRQRIIKERDEAVILDRRHAEADAVVASAKQQQAFYQQHLQELTIFKAKTSAALLQAEEWASRERREAAAIKERYDSTYAQAEGQFKGSRQLLSDIQTARARKLELQTHLDSLQRDLAQLSDLTPTQLRSENAEIQALAQQIAQLEAKLEQQDVRGTALKTAIAKLEEYGRCLGGKLVDADRGLLDLDRELTILKSNYSDGDSDHILELQRLLAVAADTYNSLVDQAVAAGIEVPLDAQTHVPPPDLRLHWSDNAASLAEDWHDFQDDGFKVLSSTLDYSRSLAAAEAKHAKTAAVAMHTKAVVGAEAAKAVGEAAEADGGDISDTVSPPANDADGVDLHLGKARVPHRSQLASTVRQ